MSKNYESMISYYQGLEGQLMPEESIIWKGQPKKNAYVVNASSKMAPLAIIWLLADFSFIIPLLGIGSELGIVLWFLVPFFLIHLLPVWIWLHNMLSASMRWKNTEYAITNQRIIMCNGLAGGEFQSIYYKDIENVSLHVGKLDRMLGVGDIIITLNFMIDGERAGGVQLLDLVNAEEVYGILQRSRL